MNTLEYEGLILDVELHTDGYLMGRIRKNKYLTFKQPPFYDISAETVKELKEMFEYKVDIGVEEYFRKQKELEETNTVVFTYKDLDLRVTKLSSGKYIGRLEGADAFAPRFKNSDLDKLRACFERYVEILLQQINVYSMMTTYKKRRKNNV